MKNQKRDFLEDYCIFHASINKYSEIYQILKNNRMREKLAKTTIYVQNEDGRHAIVSSVLVIWVINLYSQALFARQKKSR